MTNIEQKALELLKDCGGNVWEVRRNGNAWVEAICRAIEQHEAFRQEVSDAVEDAVALIENEEPYNASDLLSRFIIAKPDPLVEALQHWSEKEVGFVEAESLRAALAKRGLEIREKGK